MIRLRWRDYRTEKGRRPVREFIASLTLTEAVEVLAAMHDVATRGLTVARHLRGDLYEVRVFTDSRDFRILFAQEAKFILLSLSAFKKRTQKTPLADIELAFGAPG